MSSLLNGFGGDSGFGENSVYRNDDGYSGAVDIRSVFGENGINFYGEHYTNIYINTNGSITFQYGLNSNTPTPIAYGINFPIIAPFWADVDTRNSTNTGVPTPGGTSTGSNLIYYHLDEANRQLIVTWDDVRYYSHYDDIEYNSYPNDKLNAFQLIMTDTGNGNFDLEFRYESINWTTGDSSQGINGLGGNVARAGFSLGDQTHYFELTQSGNESGMLDLENIDIPTWSFVDGEVLITNEDQNSTDENNDEQNDIEQNNTLVRYGTQNEETISAEAGYFFNLQEDGNLYGTQPLDYAIYDGYYLNNTQDITMSVSNSSSKIGTSDSIIYNVTYTQYNSDSKIGNSSYTESLYDVERVVFEDIKVALDLNIDQSAGAAFAILYTLFNYVPGIYTAGMWIDTADGYFLDDNQFDQNDYIQLSEDIIDYYAPDGVSNQFMVDLLYYNVITDSGIFDAGVKGDLIGALDNGSLTQAALVSTMAQSEWNQAHYIDLLSQGWEYQNEFIL